MKFVSVQTAIEKRPTGQVIQPTHAPMWMIREDRELFGFIRPCAPCPAVVILKDDPHAFMDEQWQYGLRSANYAMDLEDVYLLLDKALAFSNQTGFRKPGSPKADYFHRRDLDCKPPNLDKVRSCVRNVLTGMPQYSLIQAIKEVYTLAVTLIRRQTTFMAARASFASLLTTASNVLNVWTFDSHQPPPLKPGRNYPKRVEDVNPDDYLYSPQIDPDKFAVANIVNNAGDVVQFPRGGLYAWTGDHTPYSFVPHISNHGYGDVLYPMANLVPIAPDAPIPSPYRNS